MLARNLVVALPVLLFGAVPASAQAISLEFRDGRVRLSTENAPVSRILGEWARLGGTKIVNGERIPGAPVTLQLLDVPERQALDIVLRGAAGYMVAARETVIPRASVFDRILILPTSTRAPSTATLTPPPPPQQPQGPVLDDQDDTEAANPPLLRPPQPAVPVGPVTRPLPGRVQTGLNLPGVPPPESDDPPPPDDVPAAPTRSNPFGVPAGSTRPGTIAPVVPPRNPETEPQRNK